MSFLSKGVAREPLSINQLPFDGMFGYRNKIINGYVRINQRGATSINASGLYHYDRWQLEVSGITGVLGAAGDASVSDAGPNHLYLQATAAKATLAAGDYLALTQRIEGYNVADLKWGTARAKPVVVSFRASAPSTTVIAVSLRNHIAGTIPNRSFVQLVTIAAGAAATYEVVFPGCTDGTWQTHQDVGMALTFTVVCGTNLHAPTTGTWHAANYVGAAGMSNVADTVNRYVNITDVQLEEGTRATPFEVRPVTLELALCQRYFYKGFTAVGALSTAVGPNYAYPFRYPVTMRVTPTSSPAPGVNAPVGLHKYADTATGGTSTLIAHTADAFSVSFTSSYAGADNGFGVTFHGSAEF